MDVIVKSDRDQRTLDWLVAQVGESVVEGACTKLAGARKPYVSNIAKILGLTPPDEMMQTPRDTAKQRIAVIKQMLKEK
ncbi:hypothetical protein [Noviherbaspirillum autotrophicum]|uniref:Cryptic plasmid protein A n=1 Tax=Noviherbaspirillum autotrophicum TaxID=709839 RepID=A0A0C2C0W0_9BURK|nr:hypothetical protein [Noviherbaspirillum autotrophicum]KIF83941.1 cryptic plasmid protein A [Noviherbaspirillum autotrophicum]